MVNLGLYIAYILVALCAVAAVVLPLIKAFGDPKSLRGILIGFGSLVVIVLIAFLLASNTSVAGASESTSKWAGTGIITTYLLIAGVALMIVVTEVKALIK